MAEHGEIAGWMAASVAFLGALGAAMKFWNKPAPAPEKGNDMGALLQRMSDMERRQTDADRRMDDVFDLLTATQTALSTCQENTREALTRLDERRRK